MPSGGTHNFGVANVVVHVIIGPDEERGENLIAVGIGHEEEVERHVSADGGTAPAYTLALGCGTFLSWVRPSSHTCYHLACAETYKVSQKLGGIGFQRSRRQSVTPLDVRV